MTVNSLIKNFFDQKMIITVVTVTLRSSKYRNGVIENAI